MFSPCSGDVNKCDNEGSTPLHIAARYGNLNMLDLLINRHANLFALDNHGRTAARVAAYYHKIECCRYLDTLAVRWQIQNEEGVLKLQIKAMKELKKRSKVSSSDEPRKINYNYSTAPAGTSFPPPPPESKDRRASASDEVVKGGKLSQAAALRQNFELRSGQQKESPNSSEGGDRDQGGGSSSNSAGNTFRDIPKHRTGPLLNNLAQLPLNYEPPEDARHSMIDPYTATAVTHQSKARKKKSLPELELTGGHPTVTINESALTTFLHSLDLVDCVQLLHREKLDLDALSMCSEEDLISIGVSLGPRKKILNAIARRKALIAGRGRMTDTEF